MLVLVKGSYKGGCDLKVLPPLVMHDENGNYSDEMNIIYGRKEK